MVLRQRFTNIHASRPVEQINNSNAQVCVCVWVGKGGDVGRGGTPRQNRCSLPLGRYSFPVAFSFVCLLARSWRSFAQFARPDRSVLESSTTVPVALRPQYETCSANMASADVREAVLTRIHRCSVGERLPRHHCVPLCGLSLPDNRRKKRRDVLFLPGVFPQPTTAQTKPDIVC